MFLYNETRRLESDSICKEVAKQLILTISVKFRWISLYEIPIKQQTEIEN